MDAEMGNTFDGGGAMTALDAYVAHTASITAKLERLLELADNHFGVEPSAVNWAHVGDLCRVEKLLDELLGEEE